MSGSSTEVDPITLEVVRNALVGIAEEAGAALRRTAYSPNIKERMDCSTAVFDTDGRMVAQAEHIPVHLGSMPLSVAAARDAFPALDPGDQVLVSDPYAGGTHLPDWTLVAPVHDEAGDLLGYAANRAHHSDVGGAAPGSMPTGAVDIVAEGLRIPPVRLVVAGEEQRDLVALLLANTRTPGERLGDLRAQLGANHLAARRLRELAAAQGARSSTPGGLAAAMAATLDHAERTVTAALRRLPDGLAHAEDVLDDDGAGTSDIAIRASVTIADGHVTCDLTGSDPQVPGNVNCPVAVTLSAAVYALRAVVAPDVPANDGLRRALTLRTEPGTIVDARPPAAVAAGNVETSQRIVDVLLACFAQLTEDRVGAASQGTMNNTLLGGTDPRTGAAFMRMAPEKGIEPHRIGVDRHCQHVIAGVKYALRAVAVVNVDVQDRHPVPARAQPVCGNGSVVQKAEPPRQIAERMMPRRARQGIGRARAIIDNRCRRKRGLRGPIGRLPGVGSDGAGGIGLMKACLSDRRTRVGGRAPVGVNVRDHLGAGIGDARPAGVNVAQEGQVFGAVDRRDRPQPEIPRRFERASRRFGARCKRGDPLRGLGVGQDLAVGHEMLRIVAALAVVEKGSHGAPFSAASGAPDRVR